MTTNDNKCHGVHVLFIIHGGLYDGLVLGADMLTILCILIKMNFFLEYLNSETRTVWDKTMYVIMSWHQYLSVTA